MPYLVRLFGYGLKKPKVPVRGREVAGVVEAVGAGVTRFQPGDEVFGTCEGSFAEYVCAKEALLAAKPANLTFEETAAAPISAVTALQAVRDAGQVAAGQKVLVIGAGGGVGSFAVQIAKDFGAEVTGVCSAGKVDLVRSLGADHVIDYTRDDFAEPRRPVRRHYRHRRQPAALGPAEGACTAGDAGDRRRRGRRESDRRI